MPEEIEKIEANRVKKKINKKKILIITAAVLLVAVLAGGVGYLVVNNQPKGVTVDGAFIEKQRYDDLLAQADESFADEEDAKNTIARALKVDQIAKDAGIDLSQQVLDSRAIAMFDKEWNQLSDWEKQKVKVGTLIDSAYFKSQGGYEAYVFNVPFSENYGLYGDNVLKSAQDIEKARVAALAKATDVAAKLRSNPVAANDIVRDLRTVKPYSTGYGFSSNLSRLLHMTESGGLYEEGLGEIIEGESDEQMIATIKSLSAGQVSDPILESANLLSDVTPENHPYYNKVVPIAYRVFYLKQKVEKTDGQYDAVMKQLQAIKVVVNE